MPHTRTHSLSRAPRVASVAPPRVTLAPARAARTLSAVLYALAIAALVLLANIASAQAPAPFVQDSMPDGVVSIEAEHYHARTAVGAHAWSEFATGNGSGGIVMQTLPDNGTRFTASIEANAPRLDYRVQFNRAGLHYVWVRAYGPSSDSDSIHMGLNGAVSTTADTIGPFSGSSYIWRQTDSTSNILTLNVPSAGLHTVNIWMREDGCRVDKFLLTSNAGLFASGYGPPSSLRVGESGSPADTTYVSRVHSITQSNGLIFAQYTPLPGIESYQVVSSATPGGTLQPDPSASTFGYALAVDPSGDASGFFTVRANPVDDNRELAGLAISRLTYGPTPDLVRRVLTGPSPIGGSAFLNEQLAPETIPEGADADPQIVALRQKLDNRKATLADLRAWHSLRAIRADRQWLEILLQFTRNHFTTEVDTSQYHFESVEGLSAEEAQQAAVELEYRQLQAWRQILLNPNGTFFDLLEASLKSPAMTIYLDSVISSAAAPNENYPRELLELYTMGVDNGYTQTDIESLSKAMTGYRVRMVADTDINNPFAPPFVPEKLFTTGYNGWKYRKGLTAPPANWMQPAYVEDASWLTGTASIGYGDGDDATVLTDMQGTAGYSSVYFRRTFGVTGLASLEKLTLRIYIDDGFVAYLNGQEVFRYNAPGAAGMTVSHTASATGSVGDFIWQEFVINNPAQYLVEGTNLLAVHGLNAGKSSSDFSFDAEMVAGSPGKWGWVFDAAQHNPTSKVVFANARVNSRFGAPWGGQSYQLNLPARDGDAGINDALDTIAHLANLPQTMEFISVKLCQALVHENFHTGEYFNLGNQSPEARLIRACMVAWDTPGPDGRKGNLRQVVRVIVDSDLFRSQHAAHQKAKTPFEFTVSSLRAFRMASGTNFTARTDGYDLHTPTSYMGMRLFNNSTPDGYAEEGNEWIDSGTIAERMRFVQNLCMADADTLKDQDYGSAGDDNQVDPAAVATALLPVGDRTDAGKVADLFLGLLFPAIGTGNLQLERAECIALLNSNDTGVPNSSPFSAVTPGSAEYDRRLRSLAALLLASPLFQEQ